MKSKLSIRHKKSDIFLWQAFVRAAWLLLLSNFSFGELIAQNLVVDTSTSLIDGTVAPYNNVHGGDTIFLKAGNRDKLLIRNFSGAISKPITFMNKDGVVKINTGSYYGISIINCRYIRLTGQGNNIDQYGIRVERVATGAGLGIGSMSSDFEIDHISIENCLTAGIYAKTDPDCSFLATREKFTQFNTFIHDNSFANTGNEGMYIGSSLYSGMTLSCNGKDTLVMPPVLDVVKIYNNILTKTGWDGIQVSSAPLHCQVYNNIILNDSQAEMPNQMSGILLGGGSVCDCYNNLISNGKGDGIENHGLGGNRIFNNIIVNAGRSYLPDDASQMKHGIFVSDVSVLKDSAFHIFFNDIINPKSDGIRFQSIKSKNNLVASNLIINPGNYEVYESGNTTFKGKDAYVMVPNAASDVLIKNNFFSRNISNALLSTADYTVLPGSPLINNAYPGTPSAAFDFLGHRRPVGSLFDIGALEYAGGNDTLLHTANERVLAFPNPVNNTLTLRYSTPFDQNTTINIYSSKGDLLLQQENQVFLPGIQESCVDVSKLQRGVYFFTVWDAKKIISGKFIKL